MKRRQMLAALAAAGATSIIPRPGLAAPARGANKGGGSLPFEMELPPAVAIVGGEVHVGDGTVHKGGLVELRDARIARVAGPGTTPSAGLATIDASGQIITPGFIGAQTSLGLTEIGAEGSTRDTSRNTPDIVRAAYDVSKAVNADSTALAVQRTEGITSAAVTPGGGLIAGQAAWIDLVPGAHTTMVVQSRVSMTMSMGQSYAGSRAATVAKLDEVFDDADAYRKRKAAFERRQSRDLAAHRLDLEALGRVLDRQIPLFVGVQRASEILAALDFAERHKVRIVLVGASQAWRVADAIASAKVPVVLRPAANLPGGLDRLGARLDHAALLHAAGVELVIARPGEAHNVRNIRQEAGIAIANGLDRNAALAAVTRNVARAYGMDANYGTLAVGQVANVVAWNGDPFELSSWPQKVWVRGFDVSLRNRQTELRDRYLDLSRFRRR